MVWSKLIESWSNRNFGCYPYMERGWIGNVHILWRAQIGNADRDGLLVWLLWFPHGESAWSVVGCSFLKHWFWYCTKASHDPKIVCVQIFLAQAVAQQRNVSFETTSRR